MADPLGDILGSDDDDSDFSFDGMGVPGLDDDDDDDDNDNDIDFSGDLDDLDDTDDPPKPTSAPGKQTAAQTQASSSNTTKAAPAAAPASNTKPAVSSNRPSANVLDDDDDDDDSGDLDLDAVDFSKYLGNDMSTSASESGASSISLGSLAGLGRQPTRLPPAKPVAAPQEPPRPSPLAIPINTAQSKVGGQNAGAFGADDDDSPLSSVGSIAFSSPTSSVLPSNNAAASEQPSKKEAISPNAISPPMSRSPPGTAAKAPTTSSAIPQQTHAPSQSDEDDDFSRDELLSDDDDDEEDESEIGSIKITMSPSSSFAPSSTAPISQFQSQPQPHVQAQVTSTPSKLGDSTIIAQQELGDSTDNFSFTSSPMPSGIGAKSPSVSQSLSPVSNKPDTAEPAQRPDNIPARPTSINQGSFVPSSYGASLATQQPKPVAPTFSQPKAQSASEKQLQSAKPEQSAPLVDQKPVGNIKDRISMWEKQTPISMGTPFVPSSSPRHISPPTNRPAAEAPKRENTSTPVITSDMFAAAVRQFETDEGNSKSNADSSRQIPAQPSPTIHRNDETGDENGEPSAFRSRNYGFQPNISDYTNQPASGAYGKQQANQSAFPGHHISPVQTNSQPPQRPPQRPPTPTNHPQPQKNDSHSRSTAKEISFARSQETFREISQMRSQLDKRPSNIAERPASAKASPAATRPETPVRRETPRRVDKSPSAKPLTPASSSIGTANETVKSSPKPAARQVKRSSSVGSTPVRMTKSTELLLQTQKKKKEKEAKENKKKRSQTPSHGKIDFQNSRPVEERLLERKKTTETKIEARRKEIENESQKAFKPVTMSQKSRSLSKQRFQIDEKLKSKISYGDFLYEEGLQSMRMRNQPTPSSPAEDPELTFHPKISDYAKSMDANGFNGDRFERLTRLKPKPVQAETQDYKFQPTINEFKFSTDYTKDDVVTRLLQKNEDRKAHIEKLRAEVQPQNEVKPVPEISEYSKMLSLPDNVFDRLYKHGKHYDEVLCLQKQPTEVEQGKDSIGRASSTNEAKDPSRLYYEGVARRQQVQEIQEEMEQKERELHSKKKISERSAQLALQRYEKEIKRAFDDCDTDHTGFINREQLEMAFRFLSLLAWREATTPEESRLISRIWAHLDPVGAGSVNYETYSKFMLIVYDIGLPNSESRSQEFDEKDSAIASEKFTSRKLAKDLRNLVSNRLTYGKGKAKQEENLDPQVFSFKPQINPVSKEIEESKPREAERHETLYRIHKEQEIRLNLRMKARETELQKECTFNPSIKSYDDSGGVAVQKKDLREKYVELYELSRRKASPRRTTEEVKADEEMAQCTFKPDTSKSVPISTGPADVPVGFNKAVVRMRQGSLERQMLTTMKENLGKPSDSQKSVTVQPPTFLDRERKPLLYLDVNTKEQSVRLPLFKGDDPQAVAQKFSKEHELSEKMTARLEKLIRQQLDSATKPTASPNLLTTPVNSTPRPAASSSRNGWADNLGDLMHPTIYS